MAGLVGEKESDQGWVERGWRDLGAGAPADVEFPDRPVAALRAGGVGGAGKFSGGAPGPGENRVLGPRHR